MLGALAVLLLAWAVYGLATNENLSWDVFIQYVVSGPILEGLAVTLELSVFALAIGLVLGTFIALGRMSKEPVVSNICAFYVWFLRGLPVIVQLLFWGNIALFVPAIAIGVPFTDISFGQFRVNDYLTPFTASFLGLGLAESAYMSEIIRGGIQSVDSGQREAAAALGMRSGRAMRRIIIPQALRGRYSELEIKANAVDHAVVGKATLEATMYSIDLAYASWLIRPDAKLPVGRLESRIIIDSMHLGRYLGMSDLMVEAPPAETNNATGGTTESGISGSKGLVFTGTPTKADFGKRVSVAVDLSIAGKDQTTLVFTATDIQTGPGTADQAVPDDKKKAVLAAFSGTLPGQKLPFGIHPTTEGARGSDIIIEGITEGVTVRLDGFTQS